VLTKALAVDALKTFSCILKVFQQEFVVGVSPPYYYIWTQLFIHLISADIHQMAVLFV